MTDRSSTPTRRAGVLHHSRLALVLGLSGLLLVASACGADSPAPAPDQPGGTTAARSAGASGSAAPSPNPTPTASASPAPTPAAPDDDPSGTVSPTATPSGPPDPKAPKTFRPAERGSTAAPTVRVVSTSSDEARWADGLRLEVVRARQTTATGSGPGSMPGAPLTLLDLRVRNGADVTVDLSNVVLSLPYGTGSRQLAPRVYPDGAQDFSGLVEPGATSRATYAFTLAPRQRRDADLVVDLDGVHALATLDGVAR